MTTNALRNEIADVIEDEMEYPLRERAEEYAKALVNEGFGKPRQITTELELNSLKKAAVIVDTHGRVATVTSAHLYKGKPDTSFEMTGAGSTFGSSLFAFPVTVLSEGKR